MKTALRRALAATATTALLLTGAAVTAAPASAIPDGYYQEPFSLDIEQVTGGTARAITFEEWAAAGYPVPQASPTDYVSLPRIPTIYAVTFWGDAEDQLAWTALDGPQWRAAGSPRPRTAGFVAGSTVYQWGTSSELFLDDPAGVSIKLSGPEWAAAAYRAPQVSTDQGFVRLSWEPTIARMTSLSSGAGYPIGYAEWASEAFPTPAVVRRVTGDHFYQWYGSPVIYYQGPTMHRGITGAEWAGAGFPAPEVRGAPATPPAATPPAPTPPATSGNPGDVKNCADFRTQAAAQAWFNAYRQYGDPARLDQDGDGIACETLP